MIWIPQTCIIIDSAETQERTKMADVLRITLTDNKPGEPTVLQSTGADGTPQYALDLTMLLKLLTTFGPILMTIFTGGFSAATITALLQALIQFLGLPASDVQKIQASLGGPQA